MSTKDQEACHNTVLLHLIKIINWRLATESATKIDFNWWHRLGGDCRIPWSMLKKTSELSGLLSGFCVEGFLWEDDSTERLNQVDKYYKEACHNTVLLHLIKIINGRLATESATKIDLNWWHRLGGDCRIQWSMLKRASEYQVYFQDFVVKDSCGRMTRQRDWYFSLLKEPLILEETLSKFLQTVNVSIVDEMEN
ncbi:uncharacterized protein G2W53_016528 [Senna tora]|uniref:Uncharacterized protein n=1 Tax=Senna tora TaxID=362788 RepID=A0A834WQ85_9FABA|nr:uncharacterized protein G2W53_016528 [Senna tora]